MQETNGVFQRYVRLSVAWTFVEMFVLCSVLVSTQAWGVYQLFVMYAFNKS